MNETSSKFVDNFAKNRILNDKMSKVSHSPENSYFVENDKPFEAFNQYKPDLSNIRRKKEEDGSCCFSFASFFSTEHYKENGFIRLYHYPAKDTIGNILLVHGLYDESLPNYAYLIKLLNELKLDVFFMVLPYHFDRKPEESLFSGEYFLSADIFRSQNAYIQSVYDIHGSLEFVKNFNALPTLLVGFSMGGNISFRYFLLGRPMGLFLINPVTELSRLILDNPLTVLIKRDLDKFGYDEEFYKRIFKDIDPCNNLDANYDAESIAIAYSVYDQIIEEEKYKKFIDTVCLKSVNSYNAGHLNMLRVPRLSRDIYDFFIKKALK